MHLTESGTYPQFPSPNSCLAKNNQNLNPKKTSPKGFSASKCDVGNWILSKSWEFLLRIFWESFGNFLEDFLGGFFWKEFLVCIGIDCLLKFCLKARKEENFNP